MFKFRRSFTLFLLFASSLALQASDFRKCSVHFQYKQIDFDPSELHSCLYENVPGMPHEVVIISSSSPIGSAAYNHELSQKRANAVRAFVAEKSPQARMRVENIGASTQLMQNTLIYAYYRDAAQDSPPTHPVSGYKRTAQSLGTRPSFSYSLGQNRYKLANKGNYFSNQFSVDKTLNILPHLSSELFLVPGLSFSFFSHQDLHPLQAMYGKLGVRKVMRPLHLELACLGGAIFDSGFSKAVADYGIQAELAYFLSEPLRLKLSARQTRAFTGGALGVEFAF